MPSVSAEHASLTDGPARGSAVRFPRTIELDFHFSNVGLDKVKVVVLLSKPSHQNGGHNEREPAMMDFRWLPPSEVQQLNRESRELGAHPSVSTRFGRIRHAVP